MTDKILIDRSVVEKDAARYRWIRRPDNVDMDTWVVTLSNERLDAAIDAERSEK